MSRIRQESPAMPTTSGSCGPAAVRRRHSRLPEVHTFCPRTDQPPSTATAPYARSPDPNRRRVRRGVGTIPRPPHDGGQVREPLLVGPVREAHRREHFERDARPSWSTRRRSFAPRSQPRPAKPARTARRTRRARNDPPIRRRRASAATVGSCRRPGTRSLELVDRRTAHDVRAREVGAAALLGGMPLEPLLDLPSNSAGRRRLRH